jgi:hypothetical protein
MVAFETNERVGNLSRQSGFVAAVAFGKIPTWQQVLPCGLATEKSFSKF